MLAFADEHPDALWRTQLAGHFTASGLVLRPDGRGLLTHHRKLGRWLQLGGHCDGEANAARTALQEAIEESGIEALHRCSIVTAPYGSADRRLGTLGIVGPVRMEYARAFALVQHLGRTLSGWVEDGDVDAEEASE